MIARIPIPQKHGESKNTNNTAKTTKLYIIRKEHSCFLYAGRKSFLSTGFRDASNRENRAHLTENTIQYLHRLNY